MLRALICAAASACFLAACRNGPPERDGPSILLVVLDTVRADAVSAYGVVSATTPHVDALAERGLRYAHAYAPAPWTIPSHVSLFTGLGVEHHHIGVSGRFTAGPEFVMLAERLRDTGYETAAFVENALVSEPFGMNQGFEHFEARTLAQVIADFKRPGSSGFDVLHAVDAWAASRDERRPFFVFVNLFEAHEPYRVRETNPFLPPGVTAAQAARIPQPAGICDLVPSSDDLAILHGLYLGDVSSADATFGEIYRRLSGSARKRPLVTVVTADHGEQLGERRLLDHQYTVADVALHIPLVVAGLPGVAPAVIEAPVTLTDVTASVLEWAGITAAAEIDGRPLPVAAAAGAAERDLLSAYSDHEPEDWPIEKVPGASADTKRAHCGPNDRVFGDMAALIHYPYKLTWYAHYSPQLYNLAQDPSEGSDLAGQQPALVETLRAQIAGRMQHGGLFVRSAQGAIDARSQEALRALGYGE